MAWLAILASLFMLPAPSAFAGEPKTPVTVLNSYQYTSRPLNLALNSVSAIQVEDPPPFRQLILNGSIDVLAAPLSVDVVDAIRRKRAYAIVADRGLSTAERPLYQVIRRKGSLLEPGKPLRVAVRDPRTSADYLFFESWLAAARPGGIRPWTMNMSPQEAVIALREGAIEAAVLPVPSQEDAFRGLGDSIVAAEHKGPLPRLQVMVLLFSTRFLQNRREEAVKLLRAYRDAVRNASGDAGRKVDYAPDGTPDIETIQRQIDAFTRLRQLPPGLKAESLVDRDIIDDASAR